MRGLLDALRRLIAHNALFKLTSLLIAVVLWAWLQAEQVVEQSAWVKVSYELADELVMAQAPTKRLRVTVKGPQRYVKKVRKAELMLTVDMKDTAAGVQQVDFVDSDIEGLTLENIDIVGLVPNSVQVELEQKHSRSVRLAPTLVGEPSTGYRVANIEVIPEEVVVEGPFSIVERLARLSTAPVNVAGLTESKTFEVPVSLKPKSLTLATSALVEVRVTIEAMTSQRTFTEVPILVRGRDWESDVEYATVSLSGPVSALQAIDLETVTVMVRVLPETPLEPIDADAEGSSGAHYNVVHTGGAEVTVVSVEPSSFPLRPTHPPEEPE